ncbi:MAG: sce7725 family protein [Acidobacteriota bacterium]|nr:sce7725 family protein [Acidobacteriota bacterium]
MYYPYIRGTQNELLALQGCAGEIAAGGKVVPVIEPLESPVGRLARTVEQLSAASVPFILIVNPQAGELRAAPRPLENLIDGGRSLFPRGYALGYIISQATTVRDVQAFLNKHADERVAFVHLHDFDDVPRLNALVDGHGGLSHHIFVEWFTGSLYQGMFAEYPRILIRDGVKKRRNADYPPDEFFSELHRTYADLGWDGFGDFTTVGDNFDAGYRPPAVAIHLTYRSDGADIRVKHFLSRKTEVPEPLGVQVQEALSKLVKYLKTHPMPFSAACRRFLELSREAPPPGLGVIKRVSIMHHLELMNNIL